MERARKRATSESDDDFVEVRFRGQIAFEYLFSPHQRVEHIGDSRKGHEKEQNKGRNGVQKEKERWGKRRNGRRRSSSLFLSSPTMVMTLQRSICFFSSSSDTPLLMERRWAV